MTIDQKMAVALEHHKAGRLSDAEQLYRLILGQQPGHADAMHFLGVIAHQEGRRDEAIALIRQAIALDPNGAGTHYNLGNILSESGQLDEAIAAFHRAIALRPDYPDAYGNLGKALHEKGMLDESLIAFRQSIALRPSQAESHYNLGIVLHDKTLIDEAIVAFRQAIALMPGHAEAHNLLGIALADNGQFGQAVAAYHQAIRLKPNYVKAHWNLALAMLACGDFANGWREFEWRLKDPGFMGGLHRDFTANQWEGETLAGKTILLHQEGGLGDALQFIRLSPQAVAGAGRVILECQPALAPLLGQIPGIDRIICRGQPLPPFDVHSALQSLPAILGLMLDTIPNQVPYLWAPAEYRVKWRDKLPTGKLKVGLVWAGSTGDARSRNVSMYAPLAQIPGATFYSLQKGPKAKESPPPGMAWIDLMDQVQDMADTAAIIEHLDLVISVDTSVAHLAGAMGKPVWVLLPKCAEFRWMLDREDSPWYPTMRLFRERSFEDLKNVIARVVQILKDWHP